MADKNIRAVVGLKLDGADPMKQDLEKIQTAAENFGETGKAAASKLTSSFANVENGLEKIERKLDQGRAVTVRDVQVMQQQYNRLERSIEDAFGSLEKAPVEIQQAFQKATVQLDKATREVRELKDAVDDSKGTLNEAGQVYTGLGDAVQTAAGKHGALVGKIFLVTAALKEGWEMGKRFVSFTGGDDGLKLMEDAFNNLGQRIGLVIRALSDSFVATLDLVMAVVRGDWDEVKQIWNDMAQSGADAQSKIKIAFTGTLQEVQKLNGTLRDGNAAAKENAEGAKAAEEQARKLADAKKDLAEKLAKVNEELGKENAAITAQADELESVNEQINESANQLPYLETVLRNATAEYDAQGVKIQALIEQYGENSQIVKSAIEEQEQLGISVENAKRQYEGTRDAVSNLETSQKNLQQSIDKHIEKVDALKEKEKEATEEFQKAVGVTNELTTATEALGGGTITLHKANGELKTALVGNAEAANKLKDGVELVVGASGRVKMQTTEAADAQKAAAPVAETLATAQKKLASEADAAATSLKTLGDTAAQLEKVRTTIVSINEELAKTPGLATAAMNALQAASTAGMGAKKGNSDTGGGRGGGF